MPNKSRGPQSADNYHVACICPLGIELAPVEGMLDEIYEPIPLTRNQNAYTFGSIAGHNIVVATTPKGGSTAAAVVATQLLNDFPSIRFGLLVGTGSGVPGEQDIRLGDVVVSQPKDTFGGVVQYDLGKKLERGRFERTGMLNKPPSILSATVRKLEAKHIREGHQFHLFLSELLQKWPRMQDTYAYPVAAGDKLFSTSYLHSSGTTCDGCDRERMVSRPSRSDTEPQIHYGTIGSANLVVTDAFMRDELSNDMNIICFEQEAAGLMDDFPCLVIRGICNYADSHANDRWRPYAAAMAAAYIKELLASIPVQKLTQTPETAACITTEAINKHFEVPHLLSPVFTGREDVCQYLEKSLLLNSGPRQPVQRRFVLHGLGGSGKTQICLQYAQTHRERYWGIFWIDATTLDSIQNSFTQVALLLALEPNILQVKRYLASTEQPWLLIFDNADDPTLPLATYFPTGDRGGLIITSRNPGCSQYNTVGHFEVGSMPEEHALDLLFKTTTYGEQDRARGREIVTILGHLALAITQAGAYIRETFCTFDDYIALYGRRQQDLLKHEPVHSGTDYRYTVYTTWQVSLNQIESMQDTTSTFALHLLHLLCFCHHDRVPTTMFEQAWVNSKQRGRISVLSSIWPEKASNALDLRSSLNASLALLASFSLIKRESGSTVSLHPLVHDWCQARLDDEQRRLTCVQTIFLIAASADMDITPESYIYRHSLAPHIHSCLRTYRALCDQLDDDYDTQYWDSMSSVLAENGFYQDAFQLSQEIVNLRKRKLGDENTLTLISMYHLSNRYEGIGRLDEGLRLNEEVVHVLRRKLGDADIVTITAMHSLGRMYLRVGRHAESLSLIVQVQCFYESRYGRDHASSLESLQTLAAGCSLAGRHEDAMNLAEEAMQLRQRKLGDDHFSTMESKLMLSTIYGNLGRLSQAIQLAEAALQGRKNKLGNSHPDTINAMQHLAHEYSMAGRYNEALPMSEEVVRLRMHLLGDQHPDTCKALRLLSWLRERETDAREEDQEADV